MQAAGSSEQIKGVYVAQITEDGELAALNGSNQYSVSDKVIRGGVKIQKRDLETKDTKAQGGATLKDTAFEIISLNDNAVLVDGKLYNKNEVVKKSIQVLMVSLQLPLIHYHTENTVLRKVTPQRDI